MEIFFRSKEESNAAREAEFLEMEEVDRVLTYVRLMPSSTVLPHRNQIQADRYNYEIIIDRNMDRWNEEILKFVRLATKFGVRMILVGGGAVNFHGYQRHSADVDFWIDTTDENFEKLIRVFQEMEYHLREFPSEVKQGWQNISVKFSPADLSLELITRFSLDKSFDEAYAAAEIVTMQGDSQIVKWHVISYHDLIESKLKSLRSKDILDVQELERIRKNNEEK